MAKRKKPQQKRESFLQSIIRNESIPGTLLLLLAAGFYALGTYLFGLASQVTDGFFRRLILGDFELRLAGLASTFIYLALIFAALGGVLVLKEIIDRIRGR